jgi:hypothetical protein
MYPAVDYTVFDPRNFTANNNQLPLISRFMFRSLQGLHHGVMEKGMQVQQIPFV